MRFGLWLGLFFLLGTIVLVAQIVLRLELMRPGLQYINENFPIILSSMLEPIISYLVLPNYLLLSLFSVCIGAKEALSATEKVAVASGGIGAGCLIYLIFAQSAGLAFMVGCAMSFLLAISVLLG